MTKRRMFELIIYLLLLFCSVPVFSRNTFIIQSNPSNANIYVDGVNSGQVTPYTFLDFANSNYNYHKIVVRKTDYSNPGAIYRYSYNGSTQTAMIDFHTESIGQATIRSNPSGADIYLDGVYTGQITPYTFTDLCANSYSNHHVTLRKNGYPLPARKSFTIYEGYPSDIMIDYSTPQTGTAIVESNPSGADIYLDDVNTGQVTPYTFSDLVSYTYNYHAVVLRKPGYLKQSSYSFYTNTGQSVTVRVKLEEPNPRGYPDTPTDEGSYSSNSTIKFSWTQGTATDTLSGFEGYYLQIGTTTGGCEKYDGYVGLVSSKTISNCENGFIYYARVKAKNSYDEYTDYSYNSDGILVDFTPPVLGEVKNSTNYDVLVSWDPAVDNESGIAKYWYSIGTDSWGKDISTAIQGNVDGWIDNADATSIKTSGLSLGTGNKYYFTVKAQNGSGIIGSPVCSQLQEVLERPSDLSSAMICSSFLEISENGNKVMSFKKLPAGSVLRIYSLSGKLVASLNELDFGGKGEIRWDGRNNGSKMVSQGIYMYTLKDSNGNKKTGKIAVKRIE